MTEPSDYRQDAETLTFHSLNEMLGASLGAGILSYIFGAVHLAKNLLGQIIKCLFYSIINLRISHIASILIDQPMGDLKRGYLIQIYAGYLVIEAPGVLRNADAPLGNEKAGTFDIHPRRYRPMKNFCYSKGEHIAFFPRVSRPQPLLGRKHVPKLLEHGPMGAYR